MRGGAVPGRAQCTSDRERRRRRGEGGQDNCGHYQVILFHIYMFKYLSDVI